MRFTLVDSFFRQFNGHTQVNATDLRSLRYPTEDQLRALGARIGRAFPDQAIARGLVAEPLYVLDSAESLRVYFVPAGRDL